MGFGWFIVAIFPLILFPLHRLATEQTFVLVGLSLSLGIVLGEAIKVAGKTKLISIFFLFLYFFLAINSLILARKTHWVILSAEKAKNVISYFSQNYSLLEDRTIIYFKNGEVKIPAYGSSRQLYLALGNGRGLNLILKKPGLKVYFEDINPLSLEEISSQKIIILDASKFLDY